MLTSNPIKYPFLGDYADQIIPQSLHYFLSFAVYITLAIKINGVIMSAEETGYKWWLRYVIVPLIGTGGLVAIFAAWIGKPLAPAEPLKPFSQQSAAQQFAVNLNLAEQSATKWLSLQSKGDIEELAKISQLPFEYPAGVLLEHDFKQAFKSDFERHKQSIQSFKLISFKVTPAVATTKDHCSQLRNDDFAATAIYMQNRVFKFYLRRIGENMLVVGAC